MKHIDSSSCSYNQNGSRNARTVALTLASQFMDNKLGVWSESGSDKDCFGFLEWATRFGQAELVLLVLEIRGDIERPFGDRSGKDSTDLTPLCLAAKYGQEALVRLLVENGADIVRNTTALHQAAFSGHEEIVRLLIKKGADVALKDEEGLTALHSAAFKARVATVRVLLEMRGDVAVQDNEGQTPLHLAASNGHFSERVAMLDAHQEDMLLHLESEKDRIEVIRLLYEHGADVAAVDNHGRTPLHSAVMNKDETVALLLIEKGADSTIWKERSKRRMMIHIAAQNGYEKVVQVLLEIGRDVNEPDDKRRTPLHYAAEEDRVATARLLLEKGAHIEAEDSEHWTPLQSAASGGHVEIVRLLLEKGASTSARSRRSRWTPLHCAISTHWRKPVAGYEAVVRLLLKNGAEIEARDIENKTPLHWAAELGEEELARILLEFGADIEAQDCTGSTPFHWAAYRGYEAPSAYGEKAYWEHETPFYWTSNRQEAVVRLLRENGANIAVQDSRGRTPLVMLQWCAYNIPILYPERKHSSLPDTSLA
jgi:ankyrin